MVLPGITMEAVCIKMDENTLSNMDKAIEENNYSTRTDFIRDPITEKIHECHNPEQCAMPYQPEQTLHQR